MLRKKQTCLSLYLLQCSSSLHYKILKECERAEGERVLLRYNDVHSTKPVTEQSLTNNSSTSSTSTTAVRSMGASSSSSPPSSSSSAFSVICNLHALIAITCGALMMFDMKAIYTFCHGAHTATKLMGSTPHDQLLLRISDSFSGLLLVAIGSLLVMVSLVKDREFQSFFAKGCTLLHLFMAIWRVTFERRVEDLAWDWLRQTVGDVLLAFSWVFFLVYTWREKYD